MRAEAELNKLIAEWAFGDDPVVARWPEKPNFTDPTLGIAYLFKWAVPKLNYPRCIELTEVTKGWVCIVDFLEKPYYAEGKTPALALARAIEKLIDGGKGGTDA